MDGTDYPVVENDGMRLASQESEDRKPDFNQDDNKGGAGVTGRRAYRACAHCRSRKAKCDLGDIDAPRDPPCSRCKRESRECTFLPSRRGGNLAARVKGDDGPSSSNASSWRAALDHDDDGEPKKRRRSSVSQPGDVSQSGLYDFSAGPSRLNAWPSDEGVSLDPRAIGPSASASTSTSIPPQRRPSALSYGQGESSSSTHSLLNSLAQPQAGRLMAQAQAHPQTAPPLYIDPTPIFDSLYHAAYPPGPHPQPFNPPAPPDVAPQGLSSFSSVHQPLRSPSRPLSHPQPFPAPPPPPPTNKSPDHPKSITYARPGPSRPKDNSGDGDPSPSSSASGPQPRPLQPPAPPAKAKSHRSAVTHDPESFVTAGMANEADALSLLALTATGNSSRSGGAGSGKSPASEHVATPSTGRSVGAASGQHRSEAGAGGDMKDDGAESVKGESEEEPEVEVVPPLAEFDLIRQKVLTKQLLVKYVDQFFQRHHQLFPMVPSFRIPKTEAQLAHFAWKDKELLTTFVVIASRFDQEHRSVHEESWRVMARYIAGVVVHGNEATVGFVEACLLLSENLPRQNNNDVLTPMPNNSRPWDDSAQSWALVGHAVRTGYYLGLDQKTLYVDPTMPTTPELDRERLAWTYCYLFDRHISLRLGKAFWSRGPGLCFTPNDAQANFPSLRPIAGEQDDFASVVQALIELTQSMTNSHDVLYPSKDRTISLVRAGEYYRYLDEFTRSINAFRDLWQPVKFNTFPTSEIVWCTYQYLRLYIYSFAFQAHVQRAAALGADTHSGGGALFPRGLTQSPDAKFIFESIDSARQLLELCTERLHPGGALPYLPNRVILWFTFGSVFLLKAIYSGAVLQADTKPIVELIQKVIFCLGASSPDRAHIGIRHALLLRTVAKRLRQSFSDDAWVSHTGTVSPIITFPGSPSRPHSINPSPHPSSNFHFPSSSTPSNPFAGPSSSQTPQGDLNPNWPDYSHASANAQATAHQPPPPPNIHIQHNPNNPFDFDLAADFPSVPLDGNGGWPGEFGDLLAGGVAGVAGGGAEEDFFSLSNSDFWANLAVPGSGLPFR